MVYLIKIILDFRFGLDALAVLKTLKLLSALKYDLDYWTPTVFL